MFETKFKVNTAGMENAPHEVAARLREVADQLEFGFTDGTLRDVNGVLLGEWSVTWDYPEPDEDDDTWNNYEDEWVGTDDAGEDIHERVHYRWSDVHHEWYEADKVVWDAKRGSYVPE